MEQKNNPIEEVKNEVNPITDSFEAISKIMIGEEGTEDATAMFGALLSMPDDEFKDVSTILLDEINRSLNTPAERIALVAAMTAQGYTGDDLTDTFQELCNEIDTQLTDLSQIKRDWLKQLMGSVTNAINETEGISKRYIRVPYEKCHEDAKAPAYAHETDSGMDVYALEDITLAPGEQKIIPIGIKVALPAGYELQVRPKSGISAKTKLRVANAPGTIDAGYRDEIGVIIENVEPPIRSIVTDFAESPNDFIPVGAIEFGRSYTIGKGQKFAQLVLSEVPKAVLYEVESVGEIGEDRGGGFGSTSLK